MPRKTVTAAEDDFALEGGFNEAAARCRGKRPRRSRGRRAGRGFNEAAARCRGKLAEVSLRMHDEHALQ